VIDIFDQCDLDFELDRQEASTGDLLLATGGPVSQDWDTVVQVGGRIADIVESERCDACLSCRTDAVCLACGTCSDCEDICAECTPSIQFRVPEIPAGSTNVVILNGYGGTRPIPLNILGEEFTWDSASDTGRDTASDTGSDTASDTGSDTDSDTGSDTGS
jgi:hypothetical protein